MKEKKVKFVNGVVENEIINHNKKTANGLTNSKMYRTANEKKYDTFWFSQKGFLFPENNPFIEARNYTIAYLENSTTDTTEQYVKINGRWYYATEKETEMLFDPTYVGEEGDEMTDNYIKYCSLEQEDKEEKMKKEKQISQEAQEKINNIGKLINEAKEGVNSFNDDLANKFRVIALSYDDDDNDEEPLMYWEEIEPLEDLCDELEIEVPFTCDVFLRDDSYEVEYDGDILFINTEIESVISFLQGWVLSCGNSVVQQAQERIGNLLETGC